MEKTFLKTIYFLSTRPGLSIGVWIVILGLEKNYGQFLLEWGPLSKKTRNFLCYRAMTIHTTIESPRRVEKKYVVFKMFFAFSGSKKPKNSEEILVF
jgi:hypothetical protein